LVTSSHTCAFVVPDGEAVDGAVGSVVVTVAVGSEDGLLLHAAAVTANAMTIKQPATRMDEARM
jgi:hypothetical protein